MWNNKKKKRITVYIDEKQISDYQGWDWRDEIDCERSQGTFWGDENVLYLDGGGNYLAVCVSQISSKQILNWDAFHFI